MLGEKIPGLSNEKFKALKQARTVEKKKKNWTPEA